MANRGVLESKVRGSGILSLLGKEAEDEEIANFFVESIVDGMTGVRNINQASEISQIVTDFLSDYDIKVGDEGKLNGFTTKLVTDYVSTLGNKGGNDKKGKQTQPAPAKKGGKAAKKGGKKNDDDDDDIEDEIAKSSKSEKEKATQGKKDNKKQAPLKKSKQDEEEDEDDEEDDEEYEEKPVAGKKGAAKKAAKQKALEEAKKQEEEDDEDEDEEDDEEDEDETPKQKGKGAPAAKNNNKNQKQQPKKGKGKDDDDEEDEKPVKGKKGAASKKGGKGKNIEEDEEDEDEKPKGKGQQKKGKKGGKGKDIEEDEEPEEDEKSKGKKGGKQAAKKGKGQEEDEPKGKKGAKGKGKQDDEEEDEKPAAKGKKGKGKKGNQDDEEDEKPVAKPKDKKGGKVKEEEDEEVDEEEADNKSKGKKGGKQQQQQKGKAVTKKPQKEEEEEDIKPSTTKAKAQQDNKKAAPTKATGKAPAKDSKSQPKKPANDNEEDEDEKKNFKPKGKDDKKGAKKGFAALAMGESDEEDYDDEEEEEEDEEEEEEEEVEEDEEDEEEVKAREEERKKKEEEEKKKREEEEAEKKRLEEEEIKRKEEEAKAEAANKETRKQRKLRERQESSQPKAEVVEEKKETDEVTVSILDDNRKGADTMTNDIHVEKFDISFPGKILFKDASLHLNHGHKYGLVAPNGTGKSTLLKAIANRENEFQAIPKHFDIHYVEQEVVADDTPAIISVINADTERTQLLQLEKQLMASDDLNAGENLARVHFRLDQIEAYSAEARASSILAGLQFDEKMKNMPTKDFSGGWRMRISLARALFRRPTLLLLDEPTNHLDLMAVIWLETYIHRWKNTLLIVSHDQGFLNSVCTDMIHIYQTKLNYYRGNYDSFKHAFGENVSQLRKAYEKQEKMIKAIKQQKGKKDEKGKADKKAREDTKVLRNKQRKAGKDKKENDDSSNSNLNVIEKVPRDYTVVFEFPDPEMLSGPIIQVNDASFYYDPSKVIFKDLNFGIDMKSRIALVGPNGAGKSTLIKLMAGELQPTEGSIARNRKIVIGRFTQHFVDKLDMSKNPIEYLLAKFPEFKPEDMRKRLGRFGLTGVTHVQPISLLSGGQKSRVVMTEICLQNPHLLFLDEPTNHLDIESVDALAESLNEFQGGVILVSHDARLIEQVCSDIWIVGDNTVTIFDGAFEDYRDDLILEFEERERAEEEARRIKDEERKKKREEEMKEREKRQSNKN